ncbi:MAG: proline--tRNA ligase [Gaiellales bacterium]
MSSLPSPKTDFPAWYAEVVARAQLAEHAAVRGAMVIRPYGYAIWELIQRALDDRIKSTGHENMYLPLLVPMSLLAREGELIEGFAPEVAVVREAGGAELEDPLAVRPTSEALIWDTYRRWIQSHRDLPMLLNQWANVVRWEMRPRLFLRTTEFLWQEGHTAHETADEAIAEALLVLRNVYVEVARDLLALPVLTGRKSESERFPGAVDTFTMEAMMGDRKALQAATSHYLGDGFARAYDVTYTGRDGARHHPFATSWGATTRLVGAMVMAHGDERGLRVPPAVAPHQVVIVPIPSGGPDAALGEAADGLARGLRDAGLRTRIDDREHLRPGAKYAEWELRGVPLRAELGMDEVQSGRVTLCRRDTGQRETVAAARASERASQILSDVQRSLLDRATAFREANSVRAHGRDELIEFLEAGGGFATAPWCGGRACEADIRGRTSASIRLLSMEDGVDGACAACGTPATETATWARAY